MDLFKLIAKISLDSSEYEEKIDTAEKKGKNFANSLGSSILNGTKTLVSGTAKLIGIASTAISGLGAIGLKYNSDMENYTTNFKVMLGSQEKALQKVEELKEFASKTPFEMKDLADATQTLLSFGIANEKVTPTLKMIGDVSLGNQEKFKGLSLAYAQVQSSGKLMGQDLLQMINQGFNPLQIISEKTGKSMATLKDEMSKGAISADMVTEAFKIATSEGGKFNNGMQEASKTATGLISTLADNAKSLVGEVFMPISQGLLSNLLPTALEYIDKLTTTFKENGVNGLVGAVGDILADIVNKSVEYAPKVIDMAVSLIQSFLTGLNNNMQSIADGAVKIITTLINGILNLLPEILKVGLYLIIELAIGITKALPELLPKIVDIIIEIVYVILDNLDLILSAGIELLLALILGIVEAIPKLIDQIIKIMLILIDTLTRPDILEKLIYASLKIILAIAGGLIKAIPQLISAVPQLISALIGAIGNTIQSFINVGTDLIKGLWQGISDAGAWLWGKISGFFGGIVNGIKDFFGIHSPSTLFKGFGKNIDEGFVNGILDGAKKIDNAMKDVFGQYDGTEINSNINGTLSGAGATSTIKSAIFNISGVTDPEEVARIVNMRLGMVY